MVLYRYYFSVHFFRRRFRLYNGRVVDFDNPVTILTRNEFPQMSVIVFYNNIDVMYRYRETADVLPNDSRTRVVYG